jgi:hypothetical protein
MDQRPRRVRTRQPVVDDDLVAAWRSGGADLKTAIVAAFRAGALERATVARVAARLGDDATAFRNAVADAAWRREWPSDHAVFAGDESQWLLAVPVVGTRPAVAAAAAQALFRRQLERAMVRTGFLDAGSAVVLAPTVVELATLASASPQGTHALLDAALAEEPGETRSADRFAEAVRCWRSRDGDRPFGLETLFLVGTRRARSSDEFPLLEVLEDRRVIESEDREVDQFLPAPEAVHVDHRDLLCCEEMLGAVEAANESWDLAVEGLERRHDLFDIRPPVPWSAAPVEGALASVGAQFFAPAAGQVPRRGRGRANRLHLRRDARLLQMMLEAERSLLGPALVPEAVIGARVGTLARWLSDDVVWHERRASMPWPAFDA